MQWLRLCASIAGGTCLIPGWGSKIPHAAQRSPQNKKKLQNHYLLAQYLSITLGEKFQISIMMVKEHPCPLPSSCVQLATPLPFPPPLPPEQDFPQSHALSTLPNVSCFLCQVNSCTFFKIQLTGHLLQEVFLALQAVSPFPLLAV